jgi:large subunit ribosomal protein L10
MAKTKEQKQAQVDILVSQMKEAKSAVFANFQGLTVQQTEALRAACRENNIQFTASKKTLVQRAFEEAGIEGDARSYEGGVAVAFGMEDEVAPAQIIAKFAKDHDVVKLFGGILEGAYISSEKVEALSKLPNKQQMLGLLVGTLNAPISGFANVLAGNLRGLVTVLGAVKDQKEA